MFFYWSHWGPQQKYTPIVKQSLKGHACVPNILLTCYLDRSVESVAASRVGMGHSPPQFEALPSFRWKKIAKFGHFQQIFGFFPQKCILSPCAPKDLKGELGLFLTHVLTLWGGGHIDSHIWRWVIVPPDLARSFGVIWAHYRYSVIHRALAYNVHDLWPCRKGNSHLTKLLSYQKRSRGTITHFHSIHTWLQEGRHDRFPLWISLCSPQKTKKKKKKKKKIWCCHWWDHFSQHPYLDPPTENCVFI